MKNYKEFWIYDNCEEPCLAFKEKPDPNDTNVWPEECDHVIEKKVYDQLKEENKTLKKAFDEIDKGNREYSRVNDELRVEGLKYKKLCEDLAKALKDIKSVKYSDYENDLMYWSSKINTRCYEALSLFKEGE